MKHYNITVSRVLSLVGWLLVFVGLFLMFLGIVPTDWTRAAILSILVLFSWVASVQSLR